jgi:hypothetical protein
MLFLQDATYEGTSFSFEDFHGMIAALMEKGTQIADRDIAMFILTYMTVGRSDDTRGYYLSDIMSPRPMPVIGE